MVPLICSLNKYGLGFQIGFNVRNSMVLLEVKVDRSAPFQLNLPSEPDEDIKNNKSEGRVSN